MAESADTGNGPDTSHCTTEVLDYLDNDCDGKIDENFRVTLYRRQGSNEVGYRNPGGDGDHCFSSSLNGNPWCIVGQEEMWDEYLFDGFQMQVYGGFNSESDFLEVGGFTLVRLGACFNDNTNEHQYWTVDSLQYAALSTNSAVWQCSRQLGFVRTGNLIGKDPAEIPVHRHVNMSATDTMYSTTGDEGSSLGFIDKGTAWFAWQVP